MITGVNAISLKGCFVTKGLCTAMRRSYVFNKTSQINAGYACRMISMASSLLISANLSGYLSTRLVAKVHTYAANSSAPLSGIKENREH